MMIKKIILIVIIVSTWIITPVMGQSQTEDNPKTFSEKVSKYIRGAKKSLERVGQQIGEAIGLESSSLGEHSGGVKIEGKWYMPLYTTNLLHGNEFETYRDTCANQFIKKFPLVAIQSVVIPQEGWLSESVKDNNKIIGYLQTLYCYIIGKDGNDGYINARFAFKRYKDAGKEYGTVDGAWPKWERTDILTNDVYDKLLTK